MQSQVSRRDVLPHRKRLTEIGTFLDQIGNWVLLLALAVGGIVLVWLTQSLS